MTEPRILFEKVSYFEHRKAGGGQEEMVVSRADLGDNRIYVATPMIESNTAKRLRISGNIVLAEREGNQEIIHAELPERMPGDPYAPERTLTMLAFAAIKDPDMFENQNARLFIDADHIPERAEEVYRNTLGMKLRRTGYIVGEREATAFMQTSLKRALGNSSFMLRETTTYAIDPPSEEIQPVWQDENLAQ